MKKSLSLIAILLFAGCSNSGNIYETDAVGVGYDINELKLSPCACMEVIQKPGLQEWSRAQG